ncbi:MAG: hypothetical protein ACFB0D_02080 [Phormidesmis sp.]
MDAFVYFIVSALGDVIAFLLMVIAIAAPAICTLKGYTFLKTNLIAIPTLFAIIILSAYLADIYPLIQLQLLGFDLHGMSEAERMLNVAPASRALATELYGSIFGIGWPLKAIFAIVIVSPYPSATWTVVTLTRSAIKKAYQ